MAEEWEHQPYEELDDENKALRRVGVKAVFKEYNSILEEDREQKRLSRDYDRFRNTRTKGTDE